MSSYSATDQPVEALPKEKWLSVDVGYKNFALALVEYTLPNFGWKICRWECIELTSRNKHDPLFWSDILNSLYQIMKSLSSQWDQIDGVIIEQQLCFGRSQNNVIANKIAHFCHTLFFVNWTERNHRVEVFKGNPSQLANFVIQPGHKYIWDFPSYHKTQQTCGFIPNARPHPMPYHLRKAWAVDYAFYILCREGLDLDYSFLTQVKKQDDLADVLTQLEAFMILRKV